MLNIVKINGIISGTPIYKEFDNGDCYIEFRINWGRKVTMLRYGKEPKQIEEFLSIECISTHFSTARLLRDKLKENENILIEGHLISNDINLKLIIDRVIFDDKKIEDGILSENIQEQVDI